jgi:hypothetical protein
MRNNVLGAVVNGPFQINFFHIFHIFSFSRSTKIFRPTNPGSIYIPTRYIVYKLVVVMYIDIKLLMSR